MNSRPTAELERLAIDTVRVLAMDAVQTAASGHPGTPMALAPLAYELSTRHMRHDPSDPLWLDRDRFVLSAGHASMLLYAVLHLTGYDLTLDEIQSFRQWGSRTPGHPEVHVTPGVETTTGPLGQGVANSVGMALAERWLATHFNRPDHAVVDHRTWVVCSDGDLMEGVSHEAAELAGHQRLAKLTWIFDDNRITIEGRTELASSTDQVRRFQGYGWHIVRLEDGNDTDAIGRALEEAKAEREKPTLVILPTTIGWGSPHKSGSHEAHGAPLGQEEVDATKRNLGYPSLEPFHVPAEALELWRRAAERGRRLGAEWSERFERYRTEYPALADELLRTVRGDLPAGWDQDVPVLGGKADATRSSSGKVLQALATRVPELIGGSADLGSSNKTDIQGAASVLPATPGGRVFHFGVREHAMGGILNGIALHGGPRPFAGTFLIFSDYMRPSIRLAALSELAVIYLFTHDSIGLGEDGPTHQPVEQLAALRAIPNLMDLRPGDPTETAVAWKVAMEHRKGPTFVALTRQKVPALDRTRLGSAEGVRRGGYVLAEAPDRAPDVILLASGSEVQLALEASEQLGARGVAARVVSLPSWYLFARQPAAYRDEVLPPEVSARVSVEAATTFGWERWVGARGRALGLDRFGASAPSEVLFEKFGLTAEAVARAAETLVQNERTSHTSV